MSIFDRTFSAIKDVLLLRDQFTDMREQTKLMQSNMGGMLNNIRDLEQRVARLEGSDDTIRALIGNQMPRLPRK